VFKKINHSLKASVAWNATSLSPSCIMSLILGMI
jgi:hypothetical protein